MAFVKAERRRAKLKIALTGPSGSGKTYSALEMATGIGGKIAVVDTENRSASLYSDRFDFDVLEIDPPYTVQKYIDAIKDAQQAKYDILIIDSISHQWRGEGGILSKKEQMDSRGGNSFTNWAKLTPEQEHFMASLLHSDIHLIATIRSKQEYAMVEDGGKNKVQKLGMAPIQREGMEYEFTTVLDIAMNHEAAASKDRTGLFADKIFKITKDTGKIFMDWLNGAKAPAVKPIPQKNSEAMNKLLVACKKRQFDVESMKKILKCLFDLDSFTLMTDEQAEEMNIWVNKYAPEDVALLTQDGPPEEPVEQVIDEEKPF